MIDYPVTYKKPSLVEMLVEYIIDSNNIDTWYRLDLGEWLAIEINDNVKTFAFTDEEYQEFCDNLDKWIKTTFGEKIQDAINKHMEEVQEDVREHLALMSDINN